MRFRRLVLSALAVTVANVGAHAQRLADDRSRREAVQSYRSGQELMSAEKFDRAAEEFTKATQQDRCSRSPRD